MDSLAVNKACAAVLVAGIAFSLSSLVGTGLVHPNHLDKLAIKIEGADTPPPAAGGAAPAGAAGPAPIAPLLASADVGSGEAYVKKVCAACHSFNEGGKAVVGPNLYGIVGAPHAHMAGFNYSEAIKGKQGPWTFDELNQWLYKPAAYAPGTRMAFAGISNDKQRADVIDYLHTLSANPEPLPAAAQETTKAPAAQSGNSEHGTSGTPAGAAGQQTQTGAAAGNVQPQGQQGGAPAK